MRLSMPNTAARRAAPSFLRGPLLLPALVCYGSKNRIEYIIQPFPEAAIGFGIVQMLAAVQPDHGAQFSQRKSTSIRPRESKGTGSSVFN